MIPLSSDEKLNEKVSQTVCVDGLKEQSLQFAPFGAAFGYGNTMYIHSRPQSLPQIEIKSAYPLQNFSPLHRAMFQHEKKERTNEYDAAIIAAQKKSIESA